VEVLGTRVGEGTQQEGWRQVPNQFERGGGRSTYLQTPVMCMGQPFLFPCPPPQTGLVPVSTLVFGSPPHPSSQILHKMTLSLSMEMPVNGDYTFPYSAMWLAHERQTTWQNMEMDTGKFRNVQDSGRWNRYISGRKRNKPY